MNNIKDLDFKIFKDLKYKMSFNSSHNTKLELLWNILPICCLLLIAGPSFLLLYLIEDFSDCSFIIKVIGNQWYWSYEYWYSHASYAFDSVMLSEFDLRLYNQGFRLLEVDNRVELFYQINTCLLVSSTDVLHSWAVPSLGLKTDACPGRINRLVVWPNRLGVFYGQCSEICGINHAYMPIACQVSERLILDQDFEYENIIND